MAIFAGTTNTYLVGTAGGNREDLEDVIWDLFPNDTWALTNLEKVEAQSTYHEWMYDSLAAATVNRQIEGDDITAVSTFPNATRVGNYLQISRKTFLIATTQEVVAKAGRARESARAAIKLMRELKRDMEKALTNNQASSAGGSATARSTGSMESWIASTANGGNAINATSSASASTAAFASGAVTAPTDGTTTGALTEATLQTALELAWTDGGNPRVILASSTQKRTIDGFAGVATKYNEVGTNRSSNALIGAWDIYVSDYGNHTVVLHRYLRTSVVLCIDPDYWAVAFLTGRRPKMEALAKTGDGVKKMLITEFGLVARNPSSSAKVQACA